MNTGNQPIVPHPRNRWRAATWGTAAGLLLLPLVAMQFTAEVNWGPGDFLVVGAMLVAACGGYELAARASGAPAWRAGAALALATAFFLVWVNLAVGIIGSEGHPANLLFGGVLAVGLVAAAIGRFRPRGMVRALQATAVAQAAVVPVALALGEGRGAILCAAFVGAWLAAGWLFGRAARDAVPAA